METINNIKRTEFPQLSSFTDINHNKDNIIKYVRENPLQDYIYHFTTNKKLEYTAIINKQDFKLDTNSYIAGSTGLACVIKQFSEEIGAKLTTEMKYQPNDIDIVILNNQVRYIDRNNTDIFVINSPIKHQFDTVDIVYVTNKNVNDLLLTSDLPCRVAINETGDCWISLQCIYALLTGTYFIPNYLTNYNKFKELIEKYYDVIMGESCDKILEKNIKKVFDKLTARMLKYSNRGFSCVLCETETMLPWIIYWLNYWSKYT